MEPDGNCLFRAIADQLCSWAAAVQQSLSAVLLQDFISLLPKRVSVPFPPRCVLLGTLRI